MHKWEKAYQQKKFSINTINPSKIVKKIAGDIPIKSKVLDLGCGNGRNSIYLAKKGFHVDAIDIADLDFMSHLEGEIQENISFIKKSVTDYFEGNKYNIVIATRLFQYLNKNELHKMIDQIFESLNEGGIFVSSYNMSGGIFERKDIQVDKYIHKIEDINAVLLACGFKNIDIVEGDKKSKYVPYNSAIKTFDIIAYR
ncbi:MAG: class I SAM-dependent methyltransferase [Parcubacteria group bacterium]|jgi:2-polyprenyl-3-methyl-5-hydroxy-6-metoxy-1,4-benzoquinol methylase